MKKRIKQNWIKALRSKKYKQTYKYFKYNNCYCVMGVLLDTIKKEFKLVWKLNDEYSQFSLIYNKENMVEISYVDFLNDIGLTSNNINTLMTLNDRRKLNFRQLANYIERYI